MPPPPTARAKLPAVTTTAPATTPATAPVALKERPPQRKPAGLPPSNAAALAALRAGDKKPLADPSQKQSQDKVGNGAVAAGLARGPGSDPKFAVLKKDIAHKKRTVAASHPPAGKEATSAQDASVPPKDDEVAQGKTANAEKMNDAKPKEFDKEAFIKAVEQAIAEKAPKNLEQADEFADSGKPAEIKAEVQGKVGEGKSDSAQQIADTTAAPPDTSAAVPKQVVPMADDRPPGTPATPDPAKAAPDKLPPSATDLSAGPAKVDQEMADNQVTEKQLGTDPAFTPALKDKKAAEKHSEATPPELRKNESQQLRRTTAQAQHFGAAAMGAIAGQRVRTGRQVGSGKKTAKSSDEDKRAQVTATLQKVFDTMKTDVEGILTGLDKLVDEQFTKGEKEARDAFTAEHRRKMDEYKDKRYSGAWGLIKWGHDKLFGLPEEANRIFVEARDNYVKRMRGVISAVADTIGRELTRAKQRIATGRTELQKAVDSLPKDLKALGKQAAAGFADKFDELTQSVDDKSTELVDTLATKYTDAVKAVDDEIAAEKEKNNGLVDKALDGIKGVIKTILDLKDLLLGVLAKAAQAVMGILRDPIGFLGNLISAVGGGLKQFKNNALMHLQQGVLSWLLGTAATAGITLPTTFDVIGILLMITSLLGLTWANLRARLARKLPKEAMTAIEVGEHALPLVLEVRKRGIRALWDDLKTRVGDLKQNLIDNLVSFLLPTIVIAGITWIISLFNPASAFIRACKMIIDIVKFIVTNGRQILEFVNTVLDAVISIAKGGGGGVAGLVEKSLARSIPVLIGALAALLGVGGIAGKVKEVFQKLARPVNKAIDWVIDKIVGLAKKVWAKVKALAKKLKDRFGKKKPKDKKPGDKDDSAAKFAPEQTSLSMTGESHALIATPDEGVDIASARLKVSVKAGRVIKRLQARKRKDPKETEKITDLKAIVRTAKRVEKLVENAEKQKGKKAKRLLDYPGFPDAFRDLKEKIVKYGSDYGVKDLVEGDLGDQVKIEKEIRAAIVSVARHHDKAGRYEDVVGEVAKQVNSEEKIAKYTSFHTTPPEWRGKDLIEGATYLVVGEYARDSGRTYRILVGDQNLVGEEAKRAFAELVRVTAAAGKLSATLLKAEMSPGMIEAGKHRPDLRTRFIGMAVEKYVARTVSHPDIKRLGASRPGESVPDFLIKDGKRAIPVDVTGSSITSTMEHLQRAYVSREAQIVAYRPIPARTVDAVFT
ncbi:phage tail protein [Amycolatopsis sp. NPDC004378]